jgi:hypothetical protein
MEMANELGVTDAGVKRSYSQFSSEGGSRSGYSSYGYGQNRQGYGTQNNSSYAKVVYSSDDGYHSDLPPKQTASKTSSQPVHKQTFTPFSGFSAFNKTASAGTKNYSVGMKVKHPKFGFGTVIALKNGGNTINVAFEGQGIKELSAAIAPLEIIKTDK